MIPNGTAYENFPPFANSGTRSAPAEAKYAQGMVPADTFPAEWANYFFHGATQGITRLNADTGSIKKEINNVLNNFNITPDGTLTNQLMTALDKLKQQAALAAHPVGSLYWTSVNENPAVTFGGGTWVQVKDRFILAAGDTYSNGATGGAATVTLSTNEIPSHSHSFTPSGTVQVGNHTHSISHEHSSIFASGTTEDDGGWQFVTRAFCGGVAPVLGRTNIYVEDTNTKPEFDNSEVQRGVNERTWWAVTCGKHHHYVGVTGSIPETTMVSGFTQPTGTFSGNEGTTSTVGGGQAHNNMPPYIGKYCWERTA